MDKETMRISKTMHTIAEINEVDINDVAKMIPLLANLTGIYLAFSVDFHSLDKEGTGELLNMTTGIIGESFHSIDLEPRVYA
jgi:hypothetical protein